MKKAELWSLLTKLKGLEISNSSEATAIIEAMDRLFKEILVYHNDADNVDFFFHSRGSPFPIDITLLPSDFFDLFKTWVFEDSYTWLFTPLLKVERNALIFLDKSYQDANELLCFMKSQAAQGKSVFENPAVERQMYSESAKNSLRAHPILQEFLREHEAIKLPDTLPYGLGNLPAEMKDDKPPIMVKHDISPEMRKKVNGFTGKTVTISLHDLVKLLVEWPRYNLKVGDAPLFIATIELPSITEQPGFFSFEHRLSRNLLFSVGSSLDVMLIHYSGPYIEKLRALQDDILALGETATKETMMEKIRALKSFAGGLGLRQLHEALESLHDRLGSHVLIDLEYLESLKAIVSSDSTSSLTKTAPRK